MLSLLCCGLWGAPAARAANAAALPEAKRPAPSKVASVTTGAATLKALSPTALTPPRDAHRGLWVWNTDQVLATSAQTSAFFKGAAAAKVTDVYLYVAPNDYNDKRTALGGFNKKASQAGMRVWALDGGRTYFADASGSAPFLRGVDNMIAFNRRIGVKQRFYGFQADNEPNDNGAHKAFHDDVADSKLSKASGSGVWQDSQAADRELLMRDWLAMHRAASQKLHAAKLRFGAVMPFWTMDYNGEDIQVSFPSADSPRKGVTEQMMALVDEYVIMTYNTNVDNALGRAVAQVQLASRLPVASMPAVYASVEVMPGVGVGISYGDTPGKNSRSLVQGDINTMMDALSPYAAFGGVAIEAWEGWQALGD